VLGDLVEGFSVERGVYQGGLARAERAVDLLPQRAAPLRLDRVFPGRGNRLDGFKGRDVALAQGPFLDGVDGAEEVGPVGGLATEDVAQTQPADRAHRPIEAGATPSLQEGQIDRLRTVLVSLRGDARARAGSAQVAIQLREARGDRLGVDLGS